MRNATSALAAVLLVSCSPGVVGAQQAAGTHRVSGDRVAVYNLAGRVTVEGTSGADVTVSVAPGGEGSGRLQVASGAVNGREAFRVIYPDDRIIYPAGRTQRTELRVRDDGTFGGGDRDDRRGTRRLVITDEGSGLEAWADLTIGVPEGRDVAVHQAVGTVVVRNVEGTLLIDTQSADVDATGTRGALTVDVGSGNVAVRHAQGRLLVDTGSGDVLLDGSAADDALIDTGSGDVRASGVTAGELTVDAGSGDITLERVTADRVHLDTGSGSISVTLDSDVSDLSIDTGSGDVTVRAPASLGATVQVETGSGSIEAAVPVAVTRRSRTELTGTLGDGQGRIVIDTGSGDVTIAARE